MFKALAEVIPNHSNCVNKLKENAEKWKTYKETEQDKEVYSKQEDSLENNRNLDSGAEESS